MPRAFPLDWPVELPRTEYRERGPFNSTFDATLDELKRQMKLLRATHFMVSCNFPKARDGWPDTRAKLKGGDPGIAVWWRKDNVEYVLACDKWELPQDNLRSILKTIEADRGKIRWGCAQIEARSMQGYQSLPAPERWFETLGVPEEAPIDEIEAIFRLRVRQWHPDQAQDETDRAARHRHMQKLNEAIEQARRLLSSGRGSRRCALRPQ